MKNKITVIWLVICVAISGYLVYRIFDKVNYRDGDYSYLVDRNYVNRKYYANRRFTKGMPPLTELKHIYIYKSTYNWKKREIDILLDCQNDMLYLGHSNLVLNYQEKKSVTSVSLANSITKRLVETIDTYDVGSWNRNRVFMIKGYSSITLEFEDEVIYYYTASKSDNFEQLVQEWLQIIDEIEPCFNDYC